MNRVRNKIECYCIVLAKYKIISKYPPTPVDNPETA